MRQLRMRSSDRISGAGRSRFYPGDWWGQGFKGGDLRSKYYPALDAATGERPLEGRTSSYGESARGERPRLNTKAQCLGIKRRALKVKKHEKTL